MNLFVEKDPGFRKYEYDVLTDDMKVVYNVRESNSTLGFQINQAANGTIMYFSAPYSKGHYLKYMSILEGISSEAMYAFRLGNSLVNRGFGLQKKAVIRVFDMQTQSQQNPYGNVIYCVYNNKGRQKVRPDKMELSIKNAQNVEVGSIISKSHYIIQITAKDSQSLFLGLNLCTAILYVKYKMKVSNNHDSYYPTSVIRPFAEVNRFQQSRQVLSTRENADRRDQLDRIHFHSLSQFEQLMIKKSLDDRFYIDEDGYVVEDNTFDAGRLFTFCGHALGGVGFDAGGCGGGC